MQQSLSPRHLADAYATTRALTLRPVEPLDPEDMLVQSMPDASPAKWHLGHTTWFFEVFALAESLAAGHEPAPAPWHVLFNSYYFAKGSQHPRPKRGLLTRPALGEVLAWRERVDAAMARWFERASADEFARLAPVVELGIHHEQQHQELLLTDIKHAMGTQPLRPAPWADGSRSSRARGDERPLGPAVRLAFDGGLVEVGHAGGDFAYDNECPRHRRWLEPFEISSRLVTCGEFMEFIEDGGYDDPRHWMAEGWAHRCAEGWRAPLYWFEREGAWWTYTLAGERRVDPLEPVVHVSWYEADAFARWAGARLPDEAEWEVAAAALGASPPDSQPAVHPLPARPGPEPQQFFGAAWQWTASAYRPYPGFRPFAGDAAEYNGKFMCNQFVLRGSSCATPPGHARRTYRNFFAPHCRWQFAGIRLAWDAP